jgi:hypothetical protein
VVLLGNEKKKFVEMHVSKKIALFIAISIPELRRVNGMDLMCPGLYSPYFLLC